MAGSSNECQQSKIIEAQRRVEATVTMMIDWCDTCAFDTNGERVAQKGIDY